jgi:hypothetical protein
MFFDLFVNSTHNVAPQEEMVDLWHIKESKENVGIWSFTRCGTLKDWDLFQYILIPCTNLVYVLQRVVSKSSKNELKSNVH